MSRIAVAIALGTSIITAMGRFRCSTGNRCYAALAIALWLPDIQGRDIAFYSLCVT